MKLSATLIATALTAVILAAGCAKKEESPVDKAVESTKDALDMRDNEKLKDAGEDAKDAVSNAAEGVKDVASDVGNAAKDAAADVKEAAKDATDGK